jgi:hypothetical protein
MRQLSYSYVCHGALGQRVLSRLADCAAVAALDFAKTPDEVHASAHMAAVEVAGPVDRRLTVWTDQNLTVFAYATAPGALAAVRVHLSGSAPIAGHPACPDSAVATSGAGC